MEKFFTCRAGKPRVGWLGRGGVPTTRIVFAGWELPGKEVTVATRGKAALAGRDTNFFDSMDDRGETFRARNDSLIICKGHDIILAFELRTGVQVVI